MDLELADSAARACRGEELLSLGRYAEGFDLYDAWRQVLPHYAAEWPIPPWRGEDLGGQRFLIGGEQGFGDQIMFARFAKLLQARGADVVWLAKSPLVRLFNTCLGIRTLSLEQPAEIDGVAFYSPSNRLPNLFFPPLSAPPGEPYISPPSPIDVHGRTIGVVARGNPNHVNDAARSLPQDCADALLDLPGAMSLLPEDTGAQDFYDTAGLISGLQLVITVDTSVAHLAGAMGKPVWILLSAERTDWRWLRGRTDSPWYPSARLFRQQAAGDWARVLADVSTQFSSASHR